MCALLFDFRMPCIANIFPNYSQQDATFLDLFISTNSLHISGGSSTHHQEYRTVHTASGIVNCNDRVHFTLSLQLTIPEAVCTVVCSWWWAELPSETCRSFVEINKSRNVCILLVVIWKYVLDCVCRWKSRNGSHDLEHPAISWTDLTHWGRVTQICVFTLQLCKTDDANLRF